jgi:hypothetical protein
VRIQHNGYRISFATLYPCSQPSPELTPLSFLTSRTTSILYSFHVHPRVWIVLRGMPCFTHYSRDQSHPTFRRALHNDHTSSKGRLSYNVADDYNHIPFKFPPTSQPNKLSRQMTTYFTWTDTAQIALASYMPCLRPVSLPGSLHTNRRPNSSS